MRCERYSELSGGSSKVIYISKSMEPVNVTLLRKKKSCQRLLNHGNEILLDCLGDP